MEHSALHTSSIAKDDSHDNKYLGYYGLQKCDAILVAFSNVLINWDKKKEPLELGKGVRWPSMLLHQNVYYMAHTQEYCNDSYIVLRECKDGVNFGGIYHFSYGPKWDKKSKF